MAAVRQRRLSSLASQITVLAAVPTAVVLLAVAGLTLFLNQHTRLETFLQTDQALAEALAGDTRRALSAALIAGEQQPDFYVVSTLIAHPQDQRLDAVMGSSLAQRARALVEVALTGGDPAMSNVLTEFPAFGPIVLVARDVSERGIFVGVIRASGDITGQAWHQTLQPLFAAPEGAQLALVDGASAIAYHDELPRIGDRVSAAGEEPEVDPNDQSRARLLFAPDGLQRISAFAPLSGTSWQLLIERRWHAWGEAFSGLGVVVLVPLVGGALLPAILIALAATRVTRPLRQLAAAAGRIARGDYRPIGVAPRTGDEVEVLAEQFQIMAENLRTAYGSLEQRVTERTAQLQSVVRLAQAVSASLRAADVVQVTEREVVRSPAMDAGHVWLDEATANALGVRPDPPDWMGEWHLRDLVPKSASDDALQIRRLSHSTHRGAAQTALAVPLQLRAGRAALVSRVTPGALGQDVEPFLIAAAAQLTVALDNAWLFRRGQATAALEERKRLAREIHDTLAQTLTGVILHLEAASRGDVERGPAQAHLAEALDNARDGLREARRSVQGLRASALDGQTLEDALIVSVRRVDGAGDLEVRLSTHGDSARVPFGIATEMHRIGDEALTNLVRHAHAAHAMVNLHVDERTVRLVVADDGTGMQDAEASGRGFGLVGMRERVLRLGGELTVESTPGEGTRVEAIVPLEAGVADE